MTSSEFKRFQLFQGTLEISEEFTDFRRIQITSNDYKWIQIRNCGRIHWLEENSKEFKYFQITSRGFDRIPVTSSDFQIELWVESTKIQDSSRDFRRIQNDLNNSKWL